MPILVGFVTSLVKKSTFFFTKDSKMFKKGWMQHFFMKNVSLDFLMSIQWEFMSQKPCISEKPGGSWNPPLVVHVGFKPW